MPAMNGATVDRKDATTAGGGGGDATDEALISIGVAIDTLSDRLNRLQAYAVAGAAAGSGVSAADSAERANCVQRVVIEFNEIASLLSESAADPLLAADERERYKSLLARVRTVLAAHRTPPVTATAAARAPQTPLQQPSHRANGHGNGSSVHASSLSLSAPPSIALATIPTKPEPATIAVVPVAGSSALESKSAAPSVDVSIPVPVVRRKSPIDDVNIFNFLTWHFAGSLVSLGRSRALQDTDLDDMPARDTAKVLIGDLTAGLERQRVASEAAISERAAKGTPPPAGETNASFAAASRRTNILPVILDVFKPTLFVMAWQALFYLGVAIALCLILRELVIFVGDADVPGNTTPTWHGYVLAVALGLGACTQSVTHHAYFYKGMELGTRVRLALTALIYKKLLALKTTSLVSTTTGQVVNLISNDAARFEDLGPFAWYLWAAPLQLFVAVGLLYREVGESAFVAGATFLALCPLQMFFARRFSGFRKNTINLTDNRVKTMNEILTGVEVMKLYAWEKPMEKVITDVRKLEFESISRSAYLKATNQGIFFVSAEITCLVTFASFYYLGGTLTARVVFTTIALLNVVRMPFTNFLPFAIEKLSEVMISVSRINDFLNLPELGADAVAAANTEPQYDAAGQLLPPGSIVLQNASFSWDGVQNAAEFIGLSDLSMSLRAGSMTAVVGGVGSFKSTLLLALLREVPQLKGVMKVVAPGSVAYSSQKPWIFAGTVRDNILFDRVYDAERYSKVIEACELTTDLKNLQAGDLTVIGERGVNVSGGQKARIALARAAYSPDCDIFLFDDPLSAVDAVVARRIFDKVIGPRGILAHKTRVLATHQTHFLPEFETILLLHGGRIRAQGSWPEMSINPALIEQLDHSGKKDDAADSKSATAKPNGTSPEAIAKVLTPRTAAAAAKQATNFLNPEEDKNKITLEEDRTTGSVAFDVYLSFYRACGGYVLCAIVLLLLVTGEAGLVACDWWLSQWTSASSPDDQTFFIYLGLVCGTICLSLFRAFTFFRTVLRGSTNLHNGMFRGVIYASMRFFEANPVGRVLNRFSKDQSMCDEALPMTYYDYCQCVCLVLGSLFVVGLVNPFTLFVLVPAVPTFYYVRSSYVSCSREVKRIEAISRSPVYALFSSTLHGLQIVRAYKVGAQFFDRFTVALDNNTRPLFAFFTLGRWLGVRLDFVCALVVVVTALLGVAFSTSIGASATGFALAYALQLTALLQWAVRQSAEVENCMTSAERIQKYEALPAEGEQIIAGHRPGAAWPDKGQIVFDQYKMRYREGLDLVLKGVNVTINGREKIGVCGRTGAGKSSLLQALFRLVEPAGGRIVIDDIDISTIGLNDLRSKLAIIPQNPVLFSGTLRYNLDPFRAYSDDRLWDALDAVQLKDVFKALPDQLETRVAEYGGNFSVGQCQLICVARALLKPSRILFVDEATANVDHSTDQLLQVILRERFKDRTVFTIAHRLNTIIDSDKILVMDKGLVAEFDTPANLLSNPHGIFSQMYHQSRRLSAMSADAHASSALAAGIAAATSITAN